MSGVCTGSILDISVEELVTDLRDGVGVGKLAGVSINVLTSDVVDIGADTLVDVGAIVVVASAVIDLEFAVSVSYDVDKLTAVDSDDVTIILTASGIGVDMLADVDANAFAAGMADLNFIVPTPLTGSAPFC